MTIAATAVWRVRAGGNALNGAAYDVAAYPGGTDYSQQDGAQLTLTGLTTSAANSMTLTNPSANFTSAMVGNAIYLASGTNSIPGFYFVVSFTSSSAVVLDRTPATAGALAAGAGRLGGATNAVETITASSLGPGLHPVPGNSVYIRGGGTENPSANDYVVSGGYMNLSGGTGALGARIHYIGENGRPRLGGNNFTMFNLDYTDWSNFYFVAGGTVGAGGQALLNGGHGFVKNCVFDQNGFDTSLLVFDYSYVIGCEFFSSAAVTGTPTSYAIQIGHDVQLSYNNFHDLGAAAISMNNDYTHAMFYNLITNNGGDGIVGSNSASFTTTIFIVGNTIAGNAGHGVNLPMTGQEQVRWLHMHSNIIANHVGSGKSGLFVGGTLATNNAYAPLVDGNAFYGNTTNVTGVAIGASSVILGSDPFTASSTQDYSLVSGQAAQAAFPRLLTPANATPGQFNQHRAGRTAVRSYVDPGAVQRQEPAGGSSVVLRRPALIGVG